MMVNIIAAMSDRDGIIGINNALPWKLPSDMARFKILTNNSVVIMGRKTYESIPKKFRPLPGRMNIVLTKNKKKFYAKHDCRQVGETLIAAGSVKEALKRAAICQSLDYHLSSEVWIIGGEQIYEQFLDKNYVDFLHITVVEDTTIGHTGYQEEVSFFPLTASDIDTSADWISVQEDLVHAPKDEYRTKYRIYAFTKDTNKVRLGFLSKLSSKIINYISLP